MWLYNEVDLDRAEPMNCCKHCGKKVIGQRRAFCDKRCYQSYCNKGLYKNREDIRPRSNCMCRICLRCGKEFTAHGAVNRICNQCKGSDVFRGEDTY